MEDRAQRSMYKGMFIQWKKELDDPVSEYAHYRRLYHNEV